MNKKGLTLVELLAVIVALAIIALIATPIIRGTLEDIKSNADMESARAHIEAATNFYNRSFMNESFKEKLGSDILDDLEMTNKAKEGTVTVDKDGKVRMAVVINNKCYKKDYDDTDINVSDNIEECTFYTPTRCFEYEKGYFGYYGNEYRNVIKLTNYLCNGINGYEEITDVVIPPKIENYPVAILDETFKGNKIIKKVVLPNTLDDIGYYTFYETELTSVGPIGSGADIEIPNSVAIIGYNSFGFSKVTSVVLPKGITSIYEWAFAYDNISNIVIPSSVMRMDSYAFIGVDNLTTVTFENPIGWTAKCSSIYPSSCGTDAQSLDLSNPSTNATYLKDTYKSYNWTRN